MRSRLPRLEAALVLGMLAPAELAAQSRATAAVSTAQTARIDSVMGFEMKLRRIPGAAIAVVEHGRILYQRAYGIANLETGTALQTDAVFELASITKQFTAAGIMLLVEEGKVRLDEPISTYIENTPAEWARITVRHLLTHTSGIGASGVVRYQQSALLVMRTPQVFESIIREPLRFQPGQEGWYSDAGYFLLGMIIEKASGQPYRTFMQSRFFDPLQMTNSSITDRARILKGRVPTYQIRNGQLENWRRDWDYELPSFFGVHSTLDDLAKWDAALRGNSLLKQASLQAMWTATKLDNGQFARVLDRFYGFGFELYDLRGHRTVGHGGASGTYLLRFLDEPLSIILLTNLDATSGGRHTGLLARSIAGALRPEYRPINLLSPQTDPNPQVTRDVQTVLGALSANQESPLMSAGYRAWYATAPGFRAFFGNQIRGLTALSYLGHDELAGRVLWGEEPLDRLLYYKGDVNGRVFYFTIGVNREGKIGRLDILPYQ